ncbi:hypothetical protein F5890DRAFT_476615 [Lentinula detonsa]|uniref:Uncharacterized protein n=1 Tax=Lentinula detonsa TaxID=2804962 RepID=A0AA38PV66_9AGAR|nr:hypothetical protein F5890DRAFT_476615 [Lentinula detonsa]
MAVTPSSIPLRGSLDFISSSTLSIFNSSDDLLNLQVTEQEIGTDAEPLQDEEVVQFRAKVLDMGEGISSRERELARMVLRLTNSSRPSSAQIASQAATILDLSIHRDYLVKQAEEERARWQSEREGWERASEALIAQRNTKDHSSNRHQELERYCSILQTDNEDLRRREQRLLKRLTSLEDELVKLKPVLLLNPFPVTSSESSLAHASAYLASLPYPAASGKEAARAQRSRRKKHEAKHGNIAQMDHEGPNVTPDRSATNNVSDGLDIERNTSVLTSREADDGDHSPSSIQDHHNPNVPPFKLVPSERHIARRTEPPASPEVSAAIVGRPSTSEAAENFEQIPFDSTIDPPLASSLPKPATPSTSDARMEHLLLAARIIGRKRAAFTAGIVDAEWEREQKEKKEREKAKKQKDREKTEKEGTDKSKSGKSKEKTSTVESQTLSIRRSRARKNKGKTSAKSDGKALKRTASRIEKEEERITDDEITISSSKQSRTRQSGRSKPRTLSASSLAGSSQRTQLTGMDSLLSAARSMMDPSIGQFTARGEVNEDQIGTVNITRSRRQVNELVAGSEDTDVLPPAKRRKSLLVDANRPKRTPSALDVLADQAAAAVSTSTISTDRDSMNWKNAKDDLGDEDAEGEEDEEDDPVISTSGTNTNSPVISNEKPRRISLRSTSSRSTTNTRMIMLGKSPIGNLSITPQ